MKTGDTVTNKQGGKQSYIPERYDLIPPDSLRIMAQCLGFGAEKYGEWNWMSISRDENLNHAIRHIYEFLRGDTNEPHLANAMARICFALQLDCLETGVKDYERQDTDPS